MLGAFLMTTPPLFRFEFGHLIWNDRFMTATVEDFAVDGIGDDEQRGREFVSTPPDVVRERLQIIIGTRKDTIAFEAREMVEYWRLLGSKEKAKGGIESWKNDIMLVGE
jgi:hypothetical protein